MCKILIKNVDVKLIDLLKKRSGLIWWDFTGKSGFKEIHQVVMDVLCAKIYTKWKNEKSSNQSYNNCVFKVCFLNFRFRF